MDEFKAERIKYIDYYNNKGIDFSQKVWLNNKNAKNRISRSANPSERSRLVRDFWMLQFEPVWEQQESKLKAIQKLLTEVTVIRDM